MAAAGAPHGRASHGSVTRWSFHVFLLASGQTPVETASRNDLVTAIAGDPAGQYRVVRRRDVEESVRAIRVESFRAERAAALAQAAAENSVIVHAGGESGATAAPESELTASDEPLDIGEVLLTADTLAEGFQRMVAIDKREWMSALHLNETPDEKSSSSDDSLSRIYLMVDYPSSIPEVRALLLTGEADQQEPRQSSPGIPLLPLLDGVVLMFDPMRELRDRRKSLSQSDERRRSVARRVSVEGADTAVERTLPSAATASVFETGSPFVRDIYQQANVGGLEWSDFVFVDVPCISPLDDEPKTGPELMEDLVVVMKPLVTKKVAFKNWVSSVKTVAIPDCDTGSDNARNALSCYEEILRDVHSPSVGVAAVVIAIREAIIRSLGCEAHVATEDECVDYSPDMFVEHGDQARIPLLRSFDMFVSQRDPFCADNMKKKFCIEGLRIDDLEKALWKSCDLPGVSNNGRKAMPVHPRFSDAERSVFDTEHAMFSSAPTSRVHLVRQLLRFEELLGQAWKGKLRSRDCVEELSCDVLPQRLAALISDGSTLVKDYYEHTDSLLVSVLNPTAPGRFRAVSWSARDHVRHRPALKDWHPESPIAEEYLTPRTALASTACVALSAGELNSVAEKCFMAYPADQSVIKLYQTLHASAWLTVSLDGDVFGLRPYDILSTAAERAFAMRFYANFSDDSLLLVRAGRAQPRKPDGYSSIVASVTLQDGLVVTVSSDGTIILQRHVVEIGPEDEKYRVISGKGTVVRVQNDGTRIVMLPNGDVSTSCPTERGADLTSNPDVHDRELIVDPETNAVVERRRESDVVVVTHTDGSRVVYHADGTRIFSTASRSHTLITKPGMPDVCIDVGVNMAAQRHAEGQRVAVTKGGLRTRSIVRADGTELLVQYNTKVVAEVNGRIVVQKRDGTRIVAKDSGRVEFLPRRAIKGVQDSADDADRDELNRNSVYDFNCRDGTLSVVDHEQNRFKVDVGDGRGLPSVRVDLAGVLSEEDAERYEVGPIPAKAVINEPIEPYLFVLNGDGTGQEILRPRDVNDYVHGFTSAPVEEVPRGSDQYDRWSHPSQWAVERTFFQQLSRKDEEPEMRPWLEDKNITTTFKRLMQPVATAFGLLGERCVDPLCRLENSCTIVRRITQLRPIKENDTAEVLQSLKDWQQWRALRDINMETFTVDDERSPELMAQEAAMQRKVVAAYKATRAKKRAERQKQREQERKCRQEAGAGPMTTVKEGDEPQDGNNEEEEEDEEDPFDQLFSEETDDGSNSDADIDVDDPDELMWTAYADADADNQGHLSIAQARRALVQVLGYGVSTSDLAIQLHTHGLQEPFSVSFDVFTDIVDAFQRADSDPVDPVTRHPSNQHDLALTLPTASSASGEPM